LIEADEQRRMSPMNANTRKLVVWVLVAIGLGILAIVGYRRSEAPKSAMQAQAGYPVAPDFNLTDVHGARLTLRNYQGKVVLLDFFATWCGPCRMEIPGLVALQQKYRDQGLRVVGITVEDAAPSVRKFYQIVPLNYPVAMADEKTPALYGGIEGLPTTFLIGRDGRVYARLVGAVPASELELDVRALLDARKGNLSPAFTPSPGDSANAPRNVALAVNGERVAVSKTEHTEPSPQGRCNCGCNMSRGQCAGSGHMCGPAGKGKE
jgi:thiol-disulfide isomerase/thioredoxin